MRDVSLMPGRGRNVAVVGERGSGRSSLARCLLRVEDVEAGTITFDGTDVTHLAAADLRALRCRMQVVLQDPFGALDPRQKMGDAVAKGPIIHGVPAPAPAPQTCCRSWASCRRPPGATRTRSPAASGTASASPVRWRWSRASG